MEESLIIELFTSEFASLRHTTFHAGCIQIYLYIYMYIYVQADFTCGFLHKPILESLTTKHRDKKISLRCYVFDDNQGDG